MKPNKVILVEWVDSAAEVGWNPIKNPRTRQDKNDLKITSCGFLLFEDKKTITISAHFSGANHAHSALTIPKVAIVRRKEIKVLMRKLST